MSRPVPTRSAGAARCVAHPRRGARGLAPALALVAVLGLAGCTDVVAGRPGPAPTVSARASTSSAAPTPSPGPTTAAPTPTDTSSTPGSSTASTSPPAPPTATDSDAPSDPPVDPTDLPPGEGGLPSDPTGSVQELCTQLDFAASIGDAVDAATIRGYVGAVIAAWGATAGTADPFATVDAQTSATCPDTRSQVLALTGTPDLASTRP